MKTNQKEILLVEDDVSLGETLKERLEKEYLVDWAKTEKTALDFLNKKIFDLVILDVNLPDGSGFQIAEKKLLNQKTNFIFLTAQGDAQNRLRGYELGAEEYIPKPFHLKELLIRVKHVLDSHPKVNQLIIKNITIDFNQLLIKKDNGQMEYPAASDMKVLELLVSRSPQPVSRDEIMDFVWGEDKNPNLRTVDNAIVRIKKVLGLENETIIRNIRGVGYQWIREDL
ncbi:MAG: response regulator transcription factor [Deltaproteobacteria bacterium]|jgi:two-component system phosphate regulon response regulator PhoB|nr:response regulator transcription factor [Deltaproteobacteria bacterium]